MKAAIDNFSTASADYALYRPQSPAEVFDFLYAHCANFGAAWDCGTGNGQVACELAGRFKSVYGTDISAEQLANATQKENITYLQERAEQTSLADGSIDLVTIAQAIHWFDFDTFYREVRRVVRPGGLIAAWTYSLLRLSPTVNRVIDHLYTDITGTYWDKERKLVDDGYATIPFPFEEIVPPPVQIVKEYTLPQLQGYLRTWSGVKHYLRMEQKDPVAMITPELEKAWGSSEKLEVRWPVHIRAGIVR